MPPDHASEIDRLLNEAGTLERRATVREAAGHNRGQLTTRGRHSEDAITVAGPTDGRGTLNDDDGETVFVWDVSDWDGPDVWGE